MADVEIWVEGGAGRITLNRPDALNALNRPMMDAIDTALIDWADDAAVRMVIIDAVGERAFCAGGDIAAFYRHVKEGDFAFGRKFWRDEYRLNARIKNYENPMSRSWTASSWAAASACPPMDRTASSPSIRWSPCPNA